jgi:hypothetical protein
MKTSAPIIPLLLGTAVQVLDLAGFWVKKTMPENSGSISRSDYSHFQQFWLAGARDNRTIRVSVVSKPGEPLYTTAAETLPGAWMAGILHYVTVTHASSQDSLIAAMR